MEHAVEFNNVWKSFNRGERIVLLRDAIPLIAKRITGKKSHWPTRKFWALQDVSFRVRRGEILGIVGANGAGKTTMLKLLAGIMKPSRGSIITRGRLSCLIIAGAGFHPDFTGRENIYLNGSIMGMGKKEIDRKFDSIVEFASYGLPEYKKFIDTPVKRYSSGMFVRLGFAVAAHVEPDILLVDEILAVGDIAFQQKCLEYMNNLKRGQATVIIVSHNMEHIVRYCDRAIYLKKSKVAIEKKPSDVVNAFEHDLYKEMGWLTAGKVPGIQPRGGAFLENVELKGEKHKGEVAKLDYGKPIEAVFNYDCLKWPLSDITFALCAYKKEDGRTCFRVFSHDHGCCVQKQKGGVKLIVRHHNLLPGDYTFDIEIRSLRGDMLLAAHRLREVFIKHPDKLLDPQVYGIYQPGDVSWSLS